MSKNKKPNDEPNPEPLENQDKPRPPNPFDPELLRLKDTPSLGVEKMLTAVPCSKPNKHVFVRVHPDDIYRMDTGLFFDESQRKEAYLVSPELRDVLAGDVKAVRLFTTITRHGDVSLWPVSLPGPDGRPNSWNESMAAAADLAVDNWVRVSANMLGNRYEVVRATGNLPEPEWPAKSFSELLEICFENRFIDDYDHPILKTLRGEV